MKKKLRLKWWVKGLIELVIVIVAICSLVNVVNAKKAQDAENEKQLVENYVQCLKDNFTQRDYCSRQVSNTNYRILDQKLEKYGYSYEQVGYDLYVVEK